MDEDLRKECLNFARGYNLSVIATVDGDVPWARFMEHFRVDDDFSIWYATALSSHKVSQIRANPKVCVLIFKEDQDLRIFGKAEVHDDKQTKYSSWQDKWLNYFPQGKDDSEYVVIKIVSEKIEYRDRKKFGHIPKVKVIE